MTTWPGPEFDDVNIDDDIPDPDNKQPFHHKRSKKKPSPRPVKPVKDKKAIRRATIESQAGTR